MVADKLLDGYPLLIIGEAAAGQVEGRGKERRCHRDAFAASGSVNRPCPRIQRRTVHGDGGDGDAAASRGNIL